MLPYLFTIFGFHLPTYGLLVALAFLTALALTARLARKNGLDSETVLNLGIYCAMAGIAGAKLMMILVDFGDYARNPGMLFSLATLQAAGIFYGGLLVALLVAFFYMRRRHLPMLATADVLAPGIALGHAIGLHLVLYSAVRFFDVFLRDPQQPNPFGGPFNTAQWISLGLIATVAVISFQRSAFGVQPNPAAARKSAER